jgi:hypothetical protein
MYLPVGLRPEKFVSLYGTTPPRADADAVAALRAADRLAERVRGLSLDGLVVYDVQDEGGRTSAPRPFPFLPTIDPRVYSRRLRELTGKPTVTYKCVADMTEARWASWLTETRRDHGIDHLSLVGLPSSRGVTSTLPLPRAIRLAAAHPANFTLGGVVIAERHGQGGARAIGCSRGLPTGVASSFLRQSMTLGRPSGCSPTTCRTARGRESHHGALS